MSELTWHQQKAAKRRWETRKKPAHIMSDWGVTTLCGVKHPAVYVAHEYRNNPANRTCKKCLKKANELNLPVYDDSTIIPR